MSKSVAAMVLVFMVGGGMMSVLSGVMGVHAEAAALSLVGAGLLGSSMALGRFNGTVTVAEPEAAKI